MLFILTKVFQIPTTTQCSEMGNDSGGIQKGTRICPRLLKEFACFKTALEANADDLL